MKIETKYSIGQKVWIIVDNGGVFGTPELIRDVVEEIIIKQDRVLYRFEHFTCSGLSSKWMSKTKRGAKKIIREELL